MITTDGHFQLKGYTYIEKTGIIELLLLLLQWGNITGTLLKDSIDNIKTSQS